MSWDGSERRKDYLMFEERVNELEDKFTSLDKQLIALNIELPHLRKILENAVVKMCEYEANALKRMESYSGCRDERIKLSESVKWLWLFFTVFTVALIFIALKK